MKKKWLLTGGIGIAVLIAVSVLIGWLSIDRTAQPLAEGGFLIKGERYIAISMGYTGEGRIVAKAESFDIMEIPEDKDHNFLAVRSFTDNWTIVKESYVVPTDGKLSVAYFDHERITEGAKFELVQSILAREFESSFTVKTDSIREMPSATDSLYVGYGDCAVGTHWIGRVGNINGKLVFVTAEDMKDGNLVYTCHVVEAQYQELFKDSVQNNFETANQ